MKTIKEMDLPELGAFVASHLEGRDIPVVLVGGSCVSIYSDNRYQTHDLDFVERYYTKRSSLRAALAEIGFEEQNRYFVHPDAAYFVEFPAGPLSVGDAPVAELNRMPLETGILTLLTPEDCIRDRLTAYFHWNDRQSLEQAVWVAQRHPFDIQRVQAWAQAEGMPGKFRDFLERLE